MLRPRAAWKWEFVRTASNWRTPAASGTSPRYYVAALRSNSCTHWRS